MSVYMARTLAAAPEPQAGSMKFVGGRLCLDFVNTVSARAGVARATRSRAIGGSIGRDKLADYRDLVVWSRLAGLVSQREAQALAGEPGGTRQRRPPSFRGAGSYAKRSTACSDRLSGVWDPRARTWSFSIASCPGRERRSIWWRGSQGSPGGPTMPPTPWTSCSVPWPVRRRSF